MKIQMRQNGRENDRILTRQAKVDLDACRRRQNGGVESNDIRRFQKCRNCVAQTVPFELSPVDQGRSQCLEGCGNLTM